VRVQVSWCSIDVLPVKKFIDVGARLTAVDGPAGRNIHREFNGTVVNVKDYLVLSITDRTTMRAML
jgi:hypothetical protein